MSTPNLLYQKWTDNVARDATFSAPDGAVSSDPNYQFPSLVDDNPAKLFKFTTNVLSSIQLTFAGKQPAQNAALIHCTADAGLSVQVMGDDAAAWGSPAFSANLIIPAWINTGTVRAWPVNPWLDLEAAGIDPLGYSNYLFKFAANSQPIHIGQLWLGRQNRRFSPNIQWGLTPTLDRLQIENRTGFRVSTIYSHRSPIWAMEGTIRHTDTQRDALKEQWEDVDGRALPFLIVPDGTKNDCRLVRYQTTQLEMQYNFSNYTTMTLAFEEAARGLRPGV